MKGSEIYHMAHTFCDGVETDLYLTEEKTNNVGILDQDVNGRAGSDLEISPFCECVLSCMWVDSSVSQGEVSNCIKVYLKVCLKSRCMYVCTGQ